MVLFSALRDDLTPTAGLCGSRSCDSASRRPEPPQERPNRARLSTQASSSFVATLSLNPSAKGVDSTILTTCPVHGRAWPTAYLASVPYVPIWDPGAMPSGGCRTLRQEERAGLAGSAVHGQYQRLALDYRHPATRPLQHRMHAHRLQELHRHTPCWRGLLERNLRKL